LLATPAAPFRLVVGRRQRRLDLRLALGSITEAHSSAYVFGAFCDVTPTGAAQAVDARLDGAVAEFSRRRMFSANVGEVFILPTGTHALRPDIVLFAGLGAFDQFTDDVLELVAENVIRTFIATGVQDFATVLIGKGSGRAPATALRRLLGGFLSGLRDVDHGHDFRRITLCERNPDQYDIIKAELYRLASTDLCADIELTLEEIRLPPTVDLPPPARGLATVAEAPVYLIVRQGQLEYQTSLLTAGGKATVVIGRKAAEEKALDRFLAQIEAKTFTFSRLNIFGAELAKLVLPEDVIKVLANFQKHHLIVVHDAPSSRLPWEALRLRDWAPALGAGLSRRYLAENLSVAKWLEERRRDATLHLLLVVNPTGDLGGAEAEGARIRELFGSHPGVDIVERHQEQATKAVLREDFSSGRYDVIHYAGHAYFDPVHPARSGVLCAGQEVLSGMDLAGLGPLPSLIFFNACEAARIRRKSAFQDKSLSLRRRVEQNVGLAEAFLRGGAANYLGTYWPVGDVSAKTFAEVFYTNVMNGQPLGPAISAARRAVQRIQSIDWADYILYGSAEFVLKEKG
jgi:hypothetical protein